jgi:hypothetical protein
MGERPELAFATAQEVRGCYAMLVGKFANSSNPSSFCMAMAVAQCSRLNRDIKKFKKGPKRSKKSQKSPKIMKASFPSFGRFDLDSTH